MGQSKSGNTELSGTSNRFFLNSVIPVIVKREEKVKRGSGRGYIVIDASLPRSTLFFIPVKTSA